MGKQKMKVVERSISELIPAEYNPRQLSSEQREHIAASLKRFGFVDPVIVNTHPDRENIIIGGHMRTRVAKEELGFTEVPCVELSLTLDQEKELNIRLNKNSGSWDFDALANHFDVDDLTDWGFELGELDLDIGEDEPEVEEDDFDEDPPEYPKTELGRIYQLGDHRLMCGDSTNESDVKLLMGDDIPTLVFSDPPFDMEYSDVKKAFNMFPDVMSIYILCDKQAAKLVLDYVDIFYSTFILITKNSLLTNNRQPIVSHCMMPCFNFKNAKKDLMQVYTTVEAGRDLHHAGLGASHAKSLKTYEQFFLNWMDIGDITVDLFGHSGSSLIAADKIGLSSRTMELDPKYCDVIVKRYCKLKDINPETVFETGITKE